MSMMFTGWALEQTTGSPAAKLLLFCLADESYGDGSPRVFFRDVSRLAAKCEMTESEVLSTLELLQEKGLITPCELEPLFERNGKEIPSKFGFRFHKSAEEF